jgi:hypothetical protein
MVARAVPRAAIAPSAEGAASGLGWIRWHGTCRDSLDRVDALTASF